MHFGMIAAAGVGHGNGVIGYQRKHLHRFCRRVIGFVRRISRSMLDIRFCYIHALENHVMSEI